jgi:hypothetical protein
VGTVRSLGNLLFEFELTQTSDFADQYENVEVLGTSLLL